MVCYPIHMKVRTNVSIDKDLMNSAREKKIILSSLLERAIREELRRMNEESWVKENESAYQSYNKRVREQGVFSDGIRTF